MKILIVGAGQSGLHLALGLLKRGYDVTVMTAQKPDEIRSSAPSATQVSYAATRSYEAGLGLDFYAEIAPHINGVHLDLYPPGTYEPVVISGAFTEHAVAVDRRVKQADWLEYFIDQGGRAVFTGCTVSDLDHLTRMWDLVVVATGGDVLGELFPTNTEMTSGHPRVITQVLCETEGIEPSESGDEHAEVISSPLGRLLIVPILSQYGPAYSVCVMDSPGGPLDGSRADLIPRRGHPDPSKVTGWITETLKEQFPQVYPRVRNAVPIDSTAALVTKFRPHVRHPVATLGSGCVLGLADAVVYPDPLAYQRWAMSSISAATYLERIIEHGERPFSADWMHETFAASWDAGMGAAHRISHALHGMWDPNAPAHMTQIVAAAAGNSAVANRFIGGLANPHDYDNWLYDARDAHAYLTEVTNRP